MWLVIDQLHTKCDRALQALPGSSREMQMSARIDCVTMCGVFFDAIEPCNLGNADAKRHAQYRSSAAWENIHRENKFHLRRVFQFQF